MKLYKITFIICGVLLAFTSCKEDEVEPFSAAPGLNFINYDSGKWSDGATSYENLFTTVDFFGYYASKKTIDLEYVDVPVCLQLEGRLSDKPLNIRLKAEAAEGYEMPDLVMPSDSVMEPGKYQRIFNIRCKRPTDEKEYKVIIKVDYDNSDFVAGTKERQLYEITVKDQTDWESMWVDNAEEWNAAYSSALGNYGDVKVRFIQAALGAAGYTAQSISYKYYYQTYYPNYGFNANLMKILNDALTEYNNTHEKPLSEADGTPVTFN